MSGRQPETTLLITGPPGIGKTTAVVEALERLSIDPRRLAGFVTEELREGGQRVGFRMRSLAGVARTVAHRAFISNRRVGVYGVDVELVDYVVDTTLSIREDVDLYVVDEIAPMECFSRRFVTAVERLLQSGRPVLATVAERGQGLIESVKIRPEARLLTVDRPYRDALPARIATWVEGVLAR